MDITVTKHEQIPTGESSQPIQSSLESTDQRQADSYPGTPFKTPVNQMTRLGSGQGTLYGKWLNEEKRDLQNEELIKAKHSDSSTVL